ncbi:MAG: nucleoside triphosphate pyrophosphohydrolase [Synergistaceae bacterium]|nr:nucleoside triphosphate pyrophosphohydrolase [Synergistaceae bacterium]
MRDDLKDEVRDEVKDDEVKDNEAKDNQVKDNVKDCGEVHFFDEVVEIIERLRAPGGCPWDREQKLTDLRAYIVEEAYELADAITEEHREERMDKVREEAGDLLLQIVFAASIAKEAGAFDIRDVARALCDKLIRRHPHVFGENGAEMDSGQVLRNWERIKRGERKDKQEELSILAGVPKGLPPLLKAHRMQGKAAHVGFDWPRGDLKPLFEKLGEEVEELKEAVAANAADEMEDELGDVLFMTVNLARHLDVNPDAALSRACAKFAERFRKVERAASDRGLQLEGCSLSELDAFWNEAKSEIKNEIENKIKNKVKH